MSIILEEDISGADKKNITVQDIQTERLNIQLDSMPMKHTLTCQATVKEQRKKKPMTHFQYGNVVHEQLLFNYTYQNF